MCQSWDMGLESLYCGKWRKISKSRRDLDLDQTMPNVELVQAIFKSIEPLLFALSCTQTHTQTDRRTHTQTDMSTLYSRLINKSTFWIIDEFFRV